MFTGITEATGAVRRMVKQGEDAVLEIETSMPLQDVKIGDSISVSGACLTVTAIAGRTFAVDVSAETLSRTTLRDMTAGKTVNLEKALRLSDRLGGHLVLGHVDSIGVIIEKTARSGSLVFGFSIAPELGRYVVEKGSVTIDGISLTVNRCESAASCSQSAASCSQNDRFYVNVIPHTASGTTLGEKKVGDAVNIETDIIARYLEKLVIVAKNGDSGQPDEGTSGGISMEMLSQYGFLK